MRQVNNMNIFPTNKVQDRNRGNFTDSTAVNYTVHTENRFGVFYNHPDTLSNEAIHTWSQDCTPKDPIKENKHHGKRNNRDERKYLRPTTDIPDYSKKKLNQKVKGINKEVGSFIPTIVNGIISDNSNYESAIENSEVNSDYITKAVTELREIIKVQWEKNNPLVDHRILSIGNSKIRGYVRALQIAT
jgi:hypothetical protein